MEAARLWKRTKQILDKYGTNEKKLDYKLMRLAEEKAEWKKEDGVAYLYPEVFRGVNGGEDVRMWYFVLASGKNNLEDLKKRYGGFRLFAIGSKEGKVPGDIQRRDYSGAYFDVDMPPFGDIDARKLNSLMTKYDGLLKRLEVKPFIRNADLQRYKPRKWPMGKKSAVLTLDEEQTMGRKPVPRLVIIRRGSNLEARYSVPLDEEYYDAINCLV
jgi:hypothetical protein